jgi:prepilin-type N-terminal cleavage/methylation domain-containing protein
MKGFTLLETLVAIAILLMALLGPFTIAQQSLKSAYYARDQITAYYLAQEGVEFVRAVRDQNYLAGSDWLTGIDVACTNVACIVDYPNFTYSVCPQGGCPPLKVSSSGNLFNHASGTDSPFTRQIRLTTHPTNPAIIIVSVTVSWKSAGVPRVFTIQERLFNWL